MHAFCNHLGTSSSALFCWLEQDLDGSLQG